VVSCSHEQTLDSDHTFYTCFWMCHYDALVVIRYCFDRAYHLFSLLFGGAFFRVSF